MLQSHDEVELNKLLRRLEASTGAAARPGARTGWRAALAKALRPDPLQVALHARGDARWRGYMRWAADRARRYLLARKTARARRGASAQVAMLDWLERG